MKNIYDIHTHILPRVDDGTASMREALAVLEDEVSQGVCGIILTPHYRKGLFETEESVIYARYEALLREAKSRFPDLSLRLGCELHVSSAAYQELEKRRHVTLENCTDCLTGGDKADRGAILIEFSYEDSEDFIAEQTGAFLTRAYRPVIAHVEYYAALYKHYKVIRELRELGVTIQIDADSVLGYAGKKPMKFTRGLLKRGLVDYVASDVHNMTSRRSHIGACGAFIEAKYGVSYAEKLFKVNPGKFFEKS